MKNMKYWPSFHLELEKDYDLPFSFKSCNNAILQFCPKVLVKCKSSNIQHENVGEWFEFLRQIPFVNIAIVKLLVNWYIAIRFLLLVIVV